MSFKGIGIKYFALAIAVIAIVAGVYLTFFHSSGFEKTTATIVSVTELPKDFEDEEAKYDVVVEYTVNGQKYTEKLDYYSPSFETGKMIDVRYNPENPAEVHGGSGFGIYILIAGVVIAAIVIFSIVRGVLCAHGARRGTQALLSHRSRYAEIRSPYRGRFPQRAL